MASAGAVAALAVVAVPPVPAPSALAQAEPATTAAATGVHLAGSASAGAVYAADPAFLIPYADQFVAASVAEVTAAGAFAEATPVDPGSGAGLLPVLLAVGCPTCPAVPPVADVTATARPPQSTSEDVAIGEASLGPIRSTGPVAHADAAVADHAVASASSGTLDAASLVSGVSFSTVATAVTTTVDPFVATSRASIDLGGITFVAVATAAPEPLAAVGIQADDGSVTALPLDGMPIGEFVLRPLAEASTGHARAGAVLEREGVEGTVQEVTVLAAEADASSGDVVAVAPSPTTTPTTVAPFVVPGASAPASAERVAVPTFNGARALPTPAVAAASPLPVVRTASAPRFVLEDAARSLLWLFVAWCCLALATAGAGRRWLRPRIAADERVLHAARAAAADHLDRGA